MIKIDGEKIKLLREQQGLTQLYMATAVGVTTDTISRWENKRYPSIKEENAQKLAETLEVEVEEILLAETEDVKNEENEKNVSNQPPRTNIYSPKRKKAPLFIVLGIVVLIGCIFWSARYFMKPDVAAELRAERFMPERSLPGSPFPVVVEVYHQDSDGVSIILKESLPENSEVLQTLPSQGASSNSEEIKWLKKIDGTTRFSYLVKINSAEYREYNFTGTISTAAETGNIAVSGNNTISLGPYHWADKNGDNSISDQEILTVFDYYSGIDDFTIDIEFIEKMWLGSKYTWDESTQKISITP